jgi:Sulfotransferase family
MKDDNKSNYRYVFVCGLHRSGTTVLGRNIGRLENCTGFEKENMPDLLPGEGQFLQDVYPTGRELGGPGRIGFDRRARQTETSILLRPETVAKLKTSWHRHWEKGKQICVEKTPTNLLMTRFLQAAFPNSCFVVIRRHPIPVCLGTQRMENARPTSLHRLFEHWLLCHELFEEDKRYLKRVYELSYEDYIENPGRYHQEIATFIGTTVPKTGLEEVKMARSQKYFDHWVELLTKAPFRHYYRYIATKYEPKFATYGYSLTDFGRSREACDNGSLVAAGALSCYVADSYALMMRLVTWPPLFLKKKVKELLPKSLVKKIKEQRRASSGIKKRAEVVSL